MLYAQDTYIYLVYTSQVNASIINNVKTLGIQNITTAKGCQLLQTYYIEMVNPAYAILKITPQTQTEQDYLDNIKTLGKVKLIQKERMVTKWLENKGYYDTYLEIDSVNPLPIDFGLYK